MLENNLVQSFIVKDFLNFYYEVIRHRDKILVGYYQNFSTNGESALAAPIDPSVQAPSPEASAAPSASIPATQPPKTIKEALALRRSIPIPGVTIPSAAALTGKITADADGEVAAEEEAQENGGASPASMSAQPQPGAPLAASHGPLPQTVEADLPLLRPETSGADLAAYISGRLASLLESQALYAIQQGGEYVSEYYREAQYVMAALGDEVFLNIDWSGRAAWENTLLESELFQSHEAGARFFEKLDAFLQKREAGAAELAVIYLYALGLGFQGKYRGQMDQSQLDYYRRELYEFIFHAKPVLLVNAGPICPDALNYTLEGTAGKGLPNPRFWMLVWVAVVICCALMSLGLWVYFTTPLIGQLKAILAFAPKGSVMP